MVSRCCKSFLWKQHYPIVASTGLHYAPFVNKPKISIMFTDKGYFLFMLHLSGPIRVNRRPFSLPSQNSDWCRLCLNMGFNHLRSKDEMTRGASYTLIAWILKRCILFLFMWHWPDISQQLWCLRELMKVENYWILMHLNDVFIL